MPTYEEREAKAKELAAKTDHYTVDLVGAEKHWENLTPFMQNAFLHNADEAFIAVEREAAEAVLAKLDSTEAAHKKKAEQVQPIEGGEQDFAPEVNEENSEARIVETIPDSEGDSYLPDDEPPTEPTEPCQSAPATLPAGMYMCRKCVSAHRATSKTGKKHIQYKVG